MQSLELLVTSGTVTLIALTVLVGEVAVLLFLRRDGHRLWDLVANALSGVMLILALRSSLLAEGAIPIATFLALAFIAHVAGLLARFRR